MAILDFWVGDTTIYNFENFT